MFTRPIALALLALVAAAPLPALAARPIPAAKSKTDPRLAAEFKARDLNHDGVLTRDEVAASIAKMRVDKGVASTQQAHSLADLWFSRADTNHDNKVTLAEMKQLMIAISAKMDTNHDGVVSVEEQRAAQARAMAEVKAQQQPAGR